MDSGGFYQDQDPTFEKRPDPDPTSKKKQDPDKAGPLRKKKLFLKLKKNSPKNVATKLEGGGETLVAGPLKKELYFFAASPSLCKI